MKNYGFKGTATTAGTFKNYSESSLYINASEMILIKIGEAMKNIIRMEPDINITDAKKITGLRNIIAHQYYDINYDKIWSVILYNIPLLEKEVLHLIQLKQLNFPPK